MTTPAWPHLDGIAYGGDYNPEQWPREVWDEDVRLMREAGVNLVSIGIFSWGLLEIREGEFDFAWLDDVIDLLHANGIAVDLGTPTASPPAWFFAQYPDARAVTKDGVAMGFGARGMVSHSAPEYRSAIARIAGALAERYADHPAVVLWHIHNEYGVPVGEDFSPHAVGAWRQWLREKYGSIAGLNTAWGTAFWGQHYEEWEHVGAPAAAPSTINPAQKLDWARFTDDKLRECFFIEKAAIREVATQPITTNFMANQHHGVDLWAWAREVDIVSDDHYLWAADEEGEIGLAIAADLSRSVGGGAPWILMEHSTSAVNWQPRNVAKRPGEMARNSLTHFGRGADGILFFQWRAGRSGAEKFHSAMLPHAGTESRVFREVVDLGAKLDRLAEVRGSRVHADVAMLWDFQSFWAQDLEWRPSEDVSHDERIRAYYERLWRDDITVDFALPGHDLSRYRLVVVPAQYMLSAADAENLTAYVAQGGTLVVSFFSGVVDENDAVHPGGYGAPLAAALGVRVEEHLPLRAGDAAEIEFGGARFSADVWQEDLVVGTAEVRATYVDGPAATRAAVTRNVHGAGTAWYVSTRPDAEGLRAIMAEVYADAGVTPPATPAGVETILRRGDTADYLVAVNHGADEAHLKTTGTDLLTQAEIRDMLVLAGGDVAVVRLPHTADTERSMADRSSTGDRRTH
ncbi:beta-galactosidase [Microbacterium sp. EYE_5]|uniref:beta-galactosidase n=1 Tax=unclassified Microbacterium TaxID=2609290 RepID=UPI002005ED00|nr:MULTISPECIES: beta-galactosidase [unclassified Microbacterium]MCK6081159.1 beta-galactosidase [Microbacterium sp. EYE_382]MCK6086429.1 beta-galactosidase [Microbacterium sp. EYE_384]MCK6124073.1 beta-galactosidase [Microbacterium sp. EYE_80]MCK6126982.1 beta-galactosidase [Microbacterium sp. EYE_79]MCK6142114.1 beta-galactosidase [Microbacterium sp. EYE_39]